MSQYSRNERNANAGIVVGITPDVDYPGHPLAGIALQRQWEERGLRRGRRHLSPRRRSWWAISSRAGLRPRWAR